MEKKVPREKLFGTVCTMMRRWIFRILSTGPIPIHIAFIMDGNRRYAKKRNLEEGAGHQAGFSALMSILRYCYELGIKCVTVYAFSIDNFKRSLDEVQMVMNLTLEKIEDLLKEESIVNRYGIRVYFIGNLKLLSDPVRVAAEKAMKVTAKNNKTTLLICVAYTSTDEIVHAVQESCNNKLDEIQALNGREEEYNGTVIEDKGSVVKLVDVEERMYMAMAPDPDIVIRSSGETRLSNLLLWQTTNCLLDYPAALWPEVGFWHLVWAILNFQRTYSYFEKKKKHLQHSLSTYTTMRGMPI